jgi:hypothetical protein
MINLNYISVYRPLFSLLTSVVFWLPLAGQTDPGLLPDVVMPTPEAAAFGKYVEVPVDVASGVPSITVPIHNLTSGPLSHSISLSYHASGYKVGEVASRVGLGWNLSAGGMVSRSIQGLPDDKRIGGYYYEGHSLTANNMAEVSQGVRDGEPDIFTFSAGSISGKFYFDGSSSEPQRAVLLVDDDILVEPIMNSGRFGGFKVIDQAGTKYFFGIETPYQVPVSDKMSYPVAVGSNVESTPFSSVWHLVAIVSYDNLYRIDFNYLPEAYSYEYRASYTYARGTVNACGGFSSYIVNEPATGLNSDEYWIQHVEGFTLRSITTPFDVVTFQSSSVSRQDINGSELNQSNPGKSLKSIEIKSVEATYCKEFLLYQSYFTSKLASSAAYERRLKLDSVEERTCTGATSLPPHKFYYSGSYNGDGTQYMPDRLSPRVDHWGYFNDAAKNERSRSLIPPTTLKYLLEEVSYGDADRASSDAQLTGMLVEHQFPTGGSASYTYESNTVKGRTYGGDQSRWEVTNCTDNSLACCDFFTNTSQRQFSKADVESGRFFLQVMGMELFDLECQNDPQEEPGFVKLKIYEGDNANGTAIIENKAEVPKPPTDTPSNNGGPGTIYLPIGTFKIDLNSIEYIGFSSGD